MIFLSVVVSACSFIAGNECDASEPTSTFQKTATLNSSLVLLPSIVTDEQSVQESSVVAPFPEINCTSANVSSLGRESSIPVSGEFDLLRFVDAAHASYIPLRGSGFGFLLKS